VALKRAIGEKALRDEAKQTLNALAESETRARQQFAELDLLYRSLPVALAVFGRDMRFLRVNDEISKFDGIPVAAHVGLTIWEVTPDFANAAEGYLRNVFQKGEASRISNYRAARFRSRTPCINGCATSIPCVGRMERYQQRRSWL